MQCPQGPDHNSMHIRRLAGPAAASESGAATSVWPSKTENFAHSGRGTAQKRLSNGSRNGRVSAKVTASASPRGDQRSWGVAFPSDQASRRSSPARDKGPPGPFSPTLYLIRCTIVYYFQTHYGQSPVLIRCTLAGFYSEKNPVLNRSELRPPI